MVIVELCSSKRHANLFFEDLVKEYSNIIEKPYRGCNTIRLKNKDEIRIYSHNQNLNGLRADITLSHDIKESNELWNFNMFTKYLSTLQAIYDKEKDI